MTKADLNDLLQEQWLRRRNNGEITWTTKDNKTIPIKDMTDTHLDNAINKLAQDMDTWDLLGHMDDSMG